MRRVRWVTAASVVALATGLTTTPAQAGEGQILAAGSPEAIADSYIVKLKDSGDINAVAGRFGANVERT